MSVLNKYKKRLKQTTLNARQEMTEAYECYLEEAPNRFQYKVKKTGELGYCTIIDSNKGNEDSKSDNKFMTVSFNCNFTVGDNIIFDDERLGNNHNWIVNDQEMLGVASHRRFMIRPCNSYIKLKSSNKVYELPVYLINKTLYTSGLSTDEQIVRSDVTMNGIMSLTEEGTKFIREYFRFMVDINGDKKVFKITSLDTFTENILTFRGQSDVIIPEDDLENCIAFNKHLDNPTIPDENVEYEIVGNQTLINSADYEVNPIPTDDLIFEFEVDNPDIVDIKVVDKICILTSKNKTEWITLTAICREKNIILEKIIFVKGGD